MIAVLAEAFPEAHITGLSAGADNGIRTRDPQLGKLMLYQLSYCRTIKLAGAKVHYSFRFFVFLAKKKSDAEINISQGRREDR